MGWESEVVLPALTGLVTVLAKSRAHQTQEGTVASFPVSRPPVPRNNTEVAGNTQHCAHTQRASLFPDTQRGGCNNGLEWHVALLSPTLHLFFSVLESVKQ